MIMSYYNLAILTPRIENVSYFGFSKELLLGFVWELGFGGEGRGGLIFLF
jgi:hypothetical protein